MATGKPHPGFKAVQKKIAARSGIPMKNAGAILASSSRNASAAAKKKNPRLNRVKGGKKKSKRAKPKAFARGPSPIVSAMTRRNSGGGFGGGDSDY